MVLVVSLRPNSVRTTEQNRLGPKRLQTAWTATKGMSETFRRTAGSSRGKRSYVQSTRTTTEGQPTTRTKQRRRHGPQVSSSDDEGPANRGLTHVENKVSAAFQNFEQGSNSTETKITNSTINIISKTTVNNPSPTTAKRRRKPFTPMKNRDGGPSTRDPKRSTTSATKGAKNQTELALAEYSESGQVPERSIPQELKRVFEKLSTAEAHAEAEDPNKAIAALDVVSQFFPTVETSHEFVFNLAKQLRKSGQARFRAVAFYFCSASFIKSGDSGISHCMAGIGKVCRQTDEAQNLAIPLIEKLHARVEQNTDPLERAFCLNWFALACDSAKDCRRAIDYATQGLNLMEMETNFGYKNSPRYQVYCRLLLTRGEAHYHLQKNIKAATDLKRAAKTLRKAEDFGKKGRTVVGSKIKQCRKANNEALGFPQKQSLRRLGFPH